MNNFTWTGNATRLLSCTVISRRLARLCEMKPSGIRIKNRKKGQSVSRFVSLFPSQHVKPVSYIYLYIYLFFFLIIKL